MSGVASLSRQALNTGAWVEAPAIDAGASVAAFIVLARRTAFAFTATGPVRADGVFIGLTIAIVVDAVAGVAGEWAAKSTWVAQPLIDAAIAIIVDGIACFFDGLLFTEANEHALDALSGARGTPPGLSGGTQATNTRKIVVNDAITIIVDPITDLFGSCMNELIVLITVF